jgi:hypothetical protein
METMAPRAPSGLPNLPWRRPRVPFPLAPKSVPNDRLPQSLPRRPRLEESLRTLPEFATQHALKLPDRIHALGSAQSSYSMAVTQWRQLRELLAEASHWRDILIAEAKALGIRGYFDVAWPKRLSGTHGYKNVIFDLGALARGFRERLPELEGKTGISDQELRQANHLMLRLLGAVATRKRMPDEVLAATDIRQRMYTLFCNTYGQVRRAVCFLRYDRGDADEFAPSLYRGRVRPKRAGKQPRRRAETACCVAAAVAVPAAALLQLSA